MVDVSDGKPGPFFRRLEALVASDIELGHFCDPIPYATAK
jgi:hypothetical protein